MWRESIQKLKYSWVLVILVILATLQRSTSSISKSVDLNTSSLEIWIMFLFFVGMIQIEKKYRPITHHDDNFTCKITKMLWKSLRTKVLYWQNTDWLVRQDHCWAAGGGSGAHLGEGAVVTTTVGTDFWEPVAMCCCSCCAWTVWMRT